MTNTTNTVNINTIPVDPADPTKTGWGVSLASQYYFAIANGTSADEVFDAADIPSATQTLMASYGRGVSVNMGAGNDTVIGSAYGDSINGGDGVNKIDGGDNQGVLPGGERARDMLNVFAASQAAADALTVTAISPTATGADGAAFAEGYTIKVSNGTETDYLKNVERVNVFVASGSGYTYARTVRLALDITEVATANAASSMHEAWVNGTDFADTFNAATDISSATQTLMTNNGRGVWVDTGAGDDTIVGSGFGDDITAGAGINHVDGGANAGSPPWGGNAVDVLHVVVANQAAADAVQVVQLSASSTGVDAAAFSSGYSFKVMAGAETDYVKGIERVSVQVATTNGGSTWVRDIPLAVVVREADLSDTNSNYYHLAWVNGTANADVIDASGDTPLLSAAAKTAMAARGRGVWIDGGDGNDTITGTAYADNFRNGAGNSHIDGGANAGPNGQKGMDVFEISVATTAEMAAVTVSASDNPAYQYMVTYGSGSTQKDYLKNIEAITVNVTGTSTGKWIPLAVNVSEIAATGDLAHSLDYAWAQGTAMDDTFNAATDVSAATRALMDQHQRGVWVNLGDGNDTVTGSAYGDDVTVGSGTNYVDGGGNAGSPPWGGNAIDTLHVTVATQADAAAVQVVALGAGATGADADALSRGYAFKVTANGETDYIKGIERVSIQLDTGNGGSTWVRDIPLAVVVQEANMADPQSANFYHLAWVNGTANADVIDASASGTLLSAAAKAAMDANKRGVWIDGGDGNDIITGSAYADNFRNGAGNDKIDGGTNVSTDGHGLDVFEITVADTTAMAAVSISASDDPAYTWMVTYGAGSTEKDYLKNVEGIIVSVKGATASKWIPLAISVYESTHPATEQIAYVQGTDGDDTFDPATGLSATALANMTQYKHGVYVDLGAGNDTVTGTAYGDDFNLGAGTNYADGGANTGTSPWGGAASDALHVVVQTQAEIDAVQVTALTSGMSGADADAFTRGYTQKVVAAGGQVDYIKGVEHVFVSSATAGTVARDIPLVVSVHEISATDPNIGNYYNLAFINGTSGNDTIDANALLSDAVKTEMANRKHGVWVDGGAGDDVITGTGYSDNFRNGAGNSKIDGGANDAAAGQKGQDVFEIAVGSTAEMGAVRVQPSDDPAYQWMVTYGGTSTQKDYLKNIEGVSIFVTGSSTGKWIPLTLSVTEVSSTSTQLDNTMYYAYAQGTSQNDSFDAATDVSSATRALMTQHGRGVYVELGAGNDTMVGSAYGDDFVPGAGTNYVDGGTNLGSPPGGGAARDSVELFVASQAAADAVTVTQLTATMTGDDGAAYAAGYRNKVVNGTGAIDYLRNVETLNISIWNDKNGDGNRDYRVATDSANEVTFVRSIALSEVPDTAPTFSGAPAGVALSDAGLDYGPQGGIVLASGKLLSLSWLSGTGNAELVFVLARSNADGSVDTTFGNGTGRVVVPTSFDVGTAPVELPNGKLLLGFTTYGSNSDFKVMRMNADGSVDTTFGTGGSTVVSAGGDDALRQIAVDPNGKIVLVGNAPAADGRPIAIVRLNADGSLDSSFNGGAALTVSFGTGYHGANAVAFGADGKMIVGGVAAGAPPAAALVRVNGDGTLDNTFGTGGKLTMALGTLSSTVTAIQVLSGGKILVGAQARATAPDTDPVLVRLNADGSLDTSFGSGGMVKPHPTSGTDTLTGMQVQADGKILTAGMVGLDSNNINSVLAVTRYNADGSLDTSFGNGGSTRISVHGIGEQVASMALSGGKIVLFASTANNVQFDTTNMIVRLNGDGSLDSTFGTGNPSSLGDTLRTDGVHAQPLDINVSIYDAELALRGNYAGAKLTLARHGGASALDQYTGVGEVSLSGGVVKVAGIAIGTATQSNGTLSIAFDSNATQGLVNRAMHGIGYTNSTPGTVTIDWTFSDGNDGSQGGGGAKVATGSTPVQVGVQVSEVVRSVADPTTDSFHNPLTSRSFLATVNGTAAADTFDSATGLSSTVRGLMDTYKHGINVDMGPGDDTVTGTGYADLFTMGSGVNRVDGGGNATPASGNNFKWDALNVYAATTADANAVQINVLTASAAGADKTAYDAGYRVKVVNGSETDYLKNMQEVDVWTWNDANGNNYRESSEVTFVRSTPLTLRVYETQVSATDATRDSNGNLLSSLNSFAYGSGWKLDDNFDAARDTSAATRALMDTYHRGVGVDTGDGNDTIVGSAYGDYITAGAGVNMVDGGANAGIDTNGFDARDYLQVWVASAPGAVTAIPLTAAMSGSDGAAFAAGYTWKVSAPGETDYVKNVEEVSVFTWNDANGNGVRDNGETQYGNRILLTPRFDEIRVSTSDPTKDVDGNLLSSSMSMGWGNGTVGDDVINAANVSDATKQLMATYKRGVWMDSGAGNDKLVGSDYGDDFTSGSGINKIDGGANQGTDINGNPARDVLQIYVASQAAADAVAVNLLTATLGGADGAAYAEGYRYKVTNGTSVDYLVNVETVNISIWIDKNGNGQREWKDINDPANEITFVRSVDTSTVTAPPAAQPNTAPTFAAPPGMVFSDGGYDFAPISLVRTPDGKLLTLIEENLVSFGENYTAGLERHNADGSLDTTFANGGRVLLTVPFGSVSAPVVLADGKVLWAVSTSTGSTADFKVVRLNPDGSVDSTFGTNGSAIVSLSAGKDVPRTLLVQSDGKIVVAGTVNGGTGSADFGAVRLNTDGTLDTTYNGTGKTTFAPTPGMDSVSKAILQADGKLLITGAADTGSGGTYPVVTRFNVDGTLDTTFGTNGKVFTTSGTKGLSTAIAIAPDGSIVLAGDAANASSDVAIVKLTADGAFIPTFGTGGGVLVQNDGMDEHTIQVRTQADGKIVLAAIAGNMVEILRVNADGTMDTSFGTGGIVKLSAHGIVERTAGLLLDGDKIVVLFGSSYDTDYSETSVLARLNADGSIDTTFGGAPVSSIGGTVRGDGVIGVALDINGGVFDAELAARNNYAGASLTLVRHGGASAEDQFFGTGEVSFNNGVLTVGGTAIGHVSFASGSVTLNFENGATQALVNRALHGIAYANSSSTPPSSVVIDWNFSDGNDGSQGSNGLLRATASTTVNIGVVTDETTRSFIDPNKSPDGRTLSDVAFLASVYSTVNGETIEASKVLSANELALMDTYKHGAWFNTRGGGDTVVGTAYSDTVTLGKGVNYLDGGAGTDTLLVNVADAAAADAAQVVRLEGTLSGADADAQLKGYTHKVVTATETDYLRNVEKVSFTTPGSASGPGYHRDVALAVIVNEIDTSGGAQKVAFVVGTDWADTLDASDNGTLLPDTVKAKMGSTGFGVVVDGRSGNDTITGSSHPDVFINGTGNSRIDGGANAGANGAQGKDTFQVNVATADLAAAVTVAPSDDPNYTWMVTYGAGTEKDYLKNIEAISVNVANSSTGRYIPLGVTEYLESSANMSTAFSVGGLVGTAFSDNVNAATDLSSAAHTAMDTYHRGVWINTYEGNDTVVGTGYYDDINAGPGVNYVDGGANAGVTPEGRSHGDTLHLTVASSADAAAVQIARLVAGGTGADADAAALGYAYKVTAAGETDYVKDIEVVSIQVGTPENSTWVRDVFLALTTNQYDLSQSGSANWAQIAEVDGTPFGDTIDVNASNVLPVSLLADMAASKRGVTINGGGGNDTITGSSYPDTIINGAGNDRVDGGANQTSHNGWVDVFNVKVASVAERDAVTVALSDDPAYQYKVTYGSGSTQVDYLKNVELISVEGNSMPSRYIQLALTVGEIQSNGDLAGSWSYVWANGSMLGETFNASTDVSAATLQLMSDHGRGIYADMGAGDDTVIGSQWGDQITGGSGVNYIDGGTNLGTDPNGSPGADVLQLWVADSAAAAAVTMTALASTMTGADKAAFDAGYQYKVVSGDETDYVKNMERYTISIWNDRNHDGQRNFADSSDPANEVTFVASHDFVGAPSGVTVVGVPVI
jgi:uncharacterized delta-60 repeat protein